MTLKDIAHHAGVSVATVSKAFAGSCEISRETKDKIFEIAKAFGCYEKYYKEKYSKKVVAVICPELSSEFYGRIVDSLEKRLSEYGAVTVVSVSHFDSETEKNLFEYHAFIQKADGIIIIGKAEKIINSNNVPAVVVHSDSKNIDCISFDMENAMKEAVRYLKDNGHNKIGFIGEMYTIGKYEHFISAMKTYGLKIEDEHIEISLSRYEEAGYEAMESVLKRKNVPTAVIAAYDYMAMGAMRCIKEHGLKVPDDISVIGMDDISADSYLDTPLTSIRVHVNGIDETAVDILMKKINNKYYRTGSNIIAKGGFVERKSVKNLKETL